MSTKALKPLRRENPSNSLSITAVDFIDCVFAEAMKDETVCVVKQSIRGDQSSFWQLPDDDPTYLKWLKRQGEQAWYFCVSTLGGARNEKGTALRRRSIDAVRYHCLVLDDIGTKAEAPPVEPSWIMETSLGNFQWGYILQPDEDFQRYNALVKWCIEQGWCDPGADGITRIMRLPFSCNLKPERDNFRSVVTSWEPDRYWTLDKLAEALGLDLLGLDELERSAPGKGVKPTEGGAAALKNIDPLLDWLSDAGHIVKDDGGEFVDIRCPWHEQHTTGQDTAGYSPLGRGEGDWVQCRGFKCLHAHCAGKTYKTFSEWAVERGGPKLSCVDPLPWLQSRYIFIGVGKRVADMEQRPKGGHWLWELEDWATMHKGRIMIPGREQPIEIKTAFLESKETTKAINTQYWPVRAEDDDTVFERDGQKLVNTYVPPNWPRTTDSPDVFLDHIDFLLPDDMERDLFLDWLANKVQNPAKRSYAIVMVADEAYGVGRSWLKSMLSAALQGKVNTVTLSQLIGKGTSAEQTYNDWLVGCQFLICEEAKDNLSREDFWNGYETFKQVVDIRVMPVRVNPKYGRTRDDFAFFNALIFSNHSDALALPNNDRRVAVLTNPTKMESASYYDALEASLHNGEPQRVYWYLLNRDISKFDAVYPPMTRAKRMMIAQHKAPSEEIKGFVMEHFDGDLITKKMLSTAVILGAAKSDYDNILTKPGGMTRMLWGKMGPLRDAPHGARYSVEGEQVEVRAIRNKKKWIAVDSARETETILNELSRNDTSAE